MNLDTQQLIFAIAFILFLIFVAARFLVKPLKFLAKLVFNSVVGLVMLLAFNLIGGLISLTIPVNLVTVLVAGFLGIPGLILLIAVRLLGY